MFNYFNGRCIFDFTFWQWIFLSQLLCIISSQAHVTGTPVSQTYTMNPALDSFINNETAGILTYLFIKGVSTISKMLRDSSFIVECLMNTIELKSQLSH